MSQPRGAAGAWTAQMVRERFAQWRAAEPDRAGVLDAEAIAYVDYHAERYARLLSLIEQLIPGAAQRILDVGPNIQTELLRSTHPEALVDTLGFAHPATAPREGERHIELDLNDLAGSDHDAGPEDTYAVGLGDGYDIVILAEVIEHLHTSAATVLSRIAGWLAPRGYLVIQTPNGAALHKRLRLLAGRSPTEPPRENAKNPGHFHEYTISELRGQLTRAGFVIERLEVANHFGDATLANRLYRAAGPVMPATWRHGVTLCARPAR